MMGRCLAAVVLLTLASCSEVSQRDQGPWRDRALADAVAARDRPTTVDKIVVRDKIVGDKIAADKIAAVDKIAVDKTGTIVPLYVDPPAGAWSAIAQAKQAHPAVPVVAIVNAANGPGSAKDTSYETGIAALTAAGVQVIGYVFTSYAARPEVAVKGDIDTWKSWYAAKGLNGIFFDEQSSTAGAETYYKNLSAYAKSQGLSLTVGNPGTDTAPSYVATMDTILIYESAGLPTVASLGGWHTGYSKKSFGIIPYAVPALNASFVAAAKPYVGFIYLTSDTLPNPWDTLPSYFGALVAELDK
jgi:hypothetical protein